jgi:hypothetical protein
LLGAYTDSTAAAAELQARWGFSTVQGTIAIDSRHDRIIGRVQRQGETILEMELQNPEQISGSDVTYSDGLNLARAVVEGVERPVLLQVDPEYVFLNAQRGRPALLTFTGEAWGADHKLRCTNPIAAVFTRCDTDFPKVRFALDPTVQQARGRIKLT